ncbi:MAG: hypothetical protein ACIALR_14880, partial [Blastopirellula sp. JB062]
MSNVSKGQPLSGLIKAQDYNDLLKMLREWRRDQATGGGVMPGAVQQRSVTWVKSVSDSHDPVDAGGIMQRS